MRASRRSAGPRGLAADDPDRLLGPQPSDEPALFLGAIGEAPSGLDGQQAHRRRPAAALASAAGGAARLLCSTKFDSHILLTVVLAGDGRLLERDAGTERRPRPRRRGRGRICSTWAQLGENGRQHLLRLVDDQDRPRQRGIDVGLPALAQHLGAGPAVVGAELDADPDCISMSV